jgi:hypothetical protein
VEGQDRSLHSGFLRGAWRPRRVGLLLADGGGVGRIDRVHAFGSARHGRVGSRLPSSHSTTALTSSHASSTTLSRSSLEAIRPCASRFRILVPTISRGAGLGLLRSLQASWCREMKLTHGGDMRTASLHQEVRAPSGAVPPRDQRPNRELVRQGEGALGQSLSRHTRGATR